MTKRHRPKKENYERAVLPTAPQRSFWGGAGWKELALLAGVVFLAFLPCLRAGFVNWDDTSHVTENARVVFHSFENLIGIFRQEVNRTYIPLTTLTFNLEHALVGFAPFLYHLDNLLLHVTCTVLVFVLGLKSGLGRRAAFIAALLFGVHPARVESVAWVTQRKDVLCGVFYFLSMFFYWKSTERENQNAAAPPRGPTYRGAEYFAALGCGLLSVLAKAMALSLPWTLLLIDGLAGRKMRDRRIWLNKIPFLLLIEPVAWITYSMNARAPHLTFPEAPLTFLWSATFYLKKFLIPHPLSIIYQRPEPVSLANPEYLLALAIAAAFLIGLVRFRRHRLVLFAGLFYAGTAFFLWRYDPRDLNFVADRFLYIPGLGFCFLAGHGADVLIKQASTRKAAVLATAAVFLFCFTRTFQQSLLWTDGNKLWESALARYPESPTLLISMGNSLAKNGDYDGALTFYDRVLRLSPNSAEAFDKRGVIYDEIKNDPLRALQEFDRAVRAAPDNASAHYHRGNTFLKLKQYTEALGAFDTAARLDPNKVETYINRAFIKMNILKDYDGALADLNKSIELDPSFAESYLNRGVILGSVKSDLDGAASDFTRAIRLDPSSAQAYLNRAKIYKAQGKRSEALADYDKALQLSPGNEQIIEERKIAVSEQ